MPNTEDTGNPGAWWRPYEGQFQLELSEGVTADSQNLMLATLDLVMFTADITVPVLDAATPFATLPVECTPLYPVYLQVAATVGGALEPAIIQIADTGEMLLGSATEGAVLHLNGVSFNICGNYYRGEV